MPPQSYYAVFDGHVGVEAAVYASLHMLTNIVRHPSFQEDLTTAIKGGIKRTDEMFCKKVCVLSLWSGEVVTSVTAGLGGYLMTCCLVSQVSQHPTMKVYVTKCLFVCLFVCLFLQGFQSGTTVVAVFLRGDQLYSCWLGDSQSLLVRRGQPLQLVQPHKPDREVSKGWWVGLAAGGGWC